MNNPRIEEIRKARQSYGPVTTADIDYLLNLYDKQAAEIERLTAGWQKCIDRGHGVLNHNATLLSIVRDAALSRSCDCFEAMPEDHDANCVKVRAQSVLAELEGK